MTPLRRVITRASVICNGWHRTNKHPAGYLPAESRNELLVLMLAEMDPGVTAIAAQPTLIRTGGDDGRIFSHIPDYAVILGGDGVLVEAKPDGKAARPEVIGRLRRAADHAEWCGWDYRLALRAEMQADPRLPRVQAVWRRFRPDFDEVLRLAVANLLRARPIIIADLLSGLSTLSGIDGATFEQVLSLAANGHVFVEWDEPIGPEATVRFPDRDALPDTLLPARRPADPIGAEVRP